MTVPHAPRPSALLPFSPPFISPGYCRKTITNSSPTVVLVRHGHCPRPGPGGTRPALPSAPRPHPYTAPGPPLPFSVCLVAVHLTPVILQFSESSSLLFQRERS